MKNLILSLLLVLISSGASAKDFCLKALKQAGDPTFVLKDFAGELTYYDLVHQKIAKAIADAGAGPSSTNETKLKNGDGVSVKLGTNNYNVHINFPKSEMGGRSYGWTSGQVGDWSDAMYLQNIADTMGSDAATQIKSFYKVILEMVGESDSAGLEKLKTPNQRVANNFLAILTAEQYRRIYNTSTKWDDALIQVTLLGAFHAGQTEFTMFYTGDFTSTTKKKGPGVYANGRQGSLFDKAKDKPADMTDYHQFSGKTPDQQGSNRSGINLTRADFQRMGKAITAYEKDNPNLKKIEAIVGGDGVNVYADIAVYLTTGKAKVEDAEKLSTAVAAFMIDTYNDADAITKSLK